MAARNLSLVLTASGAVAKSLPQSLNRAGKEVQALQGRAAALRAELAQQQTAMKRAGRGTDAYRQAAQRATEVRAELGGLGDQLKEATVRQRRFNERLATGRGLLLKVGGAAAVVTAAAVGMGHFTINAAQGLRTLEVQATTSGVGLQNLNRLIAQNTESMYGNVDAAKAGAFAQADLRGSLQLLKRGIGQVDAALIAVSGFNPYEAMNLGAEELDGSIRTLIRDLVKQGDQGTAALYALRQQLGPNVYDAYFAQAQQTEGRLAAIATQSDAATKRLQANASELDDAGKAWGQLRTTVDQTKASLAGELASSTGNILNDVNEIIQYGQRAANDPTSLFTTPPKLEHFAPKVDTSFIEGIARDFAGFELPGLEGDLGTQLENLGRDFAGFELPGLEGDLGTQLENLGRDFAGFKLPGLEGDLGTQLENLFEGGRDEQPQPAALQPPNLPPLEQPAASPMNRPPVDVATGAPPPQTMARQDEGFFRNLFGGDAPQPPPPNLPPLEQPAASPMNRPPVDVATGAPPPQTMARQDEGFFRNLFGGDAPQPPPPNLPPLEQPAASPMNRPPVDVATGAPPPQTMARQDEGFFRNLFGGDAPQPPPPNLPPLEQPAASPMNRPPVDVATGAPPPQTMARQDEGFFRNLFGGDAPQPPPPNLPPLEQPAASGGFFRNLFGGGPGEQRQPANLPPVVEPSAQRPVYDDAPSPAAPVYPIYGPFPVQGQAGGGSDNAPAPVAAAPNPPSSDTYTFYITGTTNPEETADMVMKRLEEREAGLTASRT